MNDSINVKIFIFVVLLAVGMVSLVVVFNKNFTDVNNQYDQKVDELNNTFMRLSNIEGQLNKTANDLEVSSMREDDLKSRYTQIKNENEKLNKEKLLLSQRLENKTRALDLALNENAKLENSLDAARERVNRLQSRVECFQRGEANC